MKVHSSHCKKECMLQKEKIRMKMSGDIVPLSLMQMKKINKRKKMLTTMVHFK